MAGGEHCRSVNFTPSRSFGTILKAKCGEAFFPDDPFSPLKYESNTQQRAWKIVQYFIPICEWLPKYSIGVFKYDLLAGITIASLAVPQGISYANLARIPLVIGLYSSFVPPMIYAVFGTSRHLAVGTVAACSLLIAETITEKVSPTDDQQLYVSLIFTATLISGLVQLLLGILRLGLLVDFLAHSTVSGFMGGTAILICLQQMKGMLGMKNFTQKTAAVDVVKAIFKYRQEWNWKCFVIGVIFVVFLQFTRFVGRRKKPNLFWVSAVGPMVVVLTGCLLSYFLHAQDHGFPIVGDLQKGINEPSLHRINFDPKYISAPIKAGVITAFIALAEGIAIGRSFALSSNDQVDGNKEMVAFGFMNIIGSMTSCYLTTGPFSKTAVNVNAGCRTPMANAVQSICMLIVLLFVAPFFSYTPQVALAAIIMSAMFGLFKYEEYYYLLKTDKFDFIICMSAFFGVAFINMEMGLIISIGLALVRGLLYIARPASCKLDKIPNSSLFRDVDQYPEAKGGVPEGFLVLQLGSPIYFANANYLKERIMRWIRDEHSMEIPLVKSKVKYLLLDLGGVTAIDTTGVESLFEVQRRLGVNGIKIVLINPRIEAMEKLLATKFIEKIGKQSVFLSTEDAIQALRHSSQQSSQDDDIV